MRYEWKRLFIGQKNSKNESRIKNSVFFCNNNASNPQFKLQRVGGEFDKQKIDEKIQEKSYL